MLEWDWNQNQAETQRQYEEMMASLYPWNYGMSQSSTTGQWSP
jgi:hypothetical protein